ncbi:MAG: response regulator, partial [Saprospiraceae bacterium]|nr:response regulator [Saprospiraceae bacterium]
TQSGKVDLLVSGKELDDQTINLSIKVRDTGIGISAEKLGKIFDRFGQASADTTRRFGGTGLGLTITKQLVELQKGQIMVESKEGEGTCFTVQIPYEVAAEDAHRITNGSLPLDELKDMDISILVVEDNPMNQRIIEILLDEWKIRHKHVYNGKEAIKLLKKEAFDLIFMDIQMPELDGYSTTSIIRQKLHLEVPIIATTAHAFPGEREKCISYGMNDYIAKPLQHNELYSLILRYTGKKRAWQDTPDLMAKSETGFDRDYIMDITQGKEETIREMAQLFIDQSAKELNVIDGAAKHLDFPAMAKAAHSLKSTTAYMGFNEDLGQKVHALEQLAMAEDPLVTKIREQIKAVKLSREKAISYLKSEFLSKV